MSELLLDALMQLFALLTDINKEQNTGRAHVSIKDYLERQFNSELAKKYLELYHDYLQAFHGADFLQDNQPISADKESNLNQILTICTKATYEY